MALRSQRLSELFRSMGYKEPTASVTNDEQPKEVAVGIGADADGNDTEETVISEGVTLPKVEQKTPDDVKEDVQQTLPTDEDKKDDIQQVVDHYQRGYDVTDAMEKQNIRNRMNNQRTNLTQFVNEDVMNRLDDDDNDDVMGEIETYGWSDDEKKQVRDYMDSRRAYNGMIAKVQDDIDAAVTANDDMINQRVASVENGGDGMIHPATMAVDNRQVDIVSGNVVMTDDGTMIDHAKSDKDIIVRDRNTGKVEYVGINSLKSVEAPVDAEQLKASDAERISNEMAQAASKEIDGTLDFNAGDVYTLADDNGEVRDIQVLQDNGDGNVTVSIDGEQTVMPKDEMQQMADSTNMRRVTENEVQQPVDVAAQKGKKDGDMPMIDKDGEEEPDFMATTPQRGRKYLYEEAGLDTEEADKIAQNNRKAAEKELTELKDKKPEPSTDVAKYQREKEEYNRKVEEAQKKVDYWQTILDNTPMSSAGASIMRSQMTAMDKKFADYVKERQDYYNAHGKDDPNISPVSRIVPDLLFSGQAETPEEALQIAKDLLWRNADISSREIAGNFVMSLPNDAANMGENINKAWYTESMQKEVERKAHELGLFYNDYVKYAVIPAFRSEMQHRFHLSEQSARAWSSYIFSDYGAAVNEMRQQEANAIVRPYVQEFITDAFSQVDEEARKMWQSINDNNTTMYTPQGVPTTAGLNIYGLMKEQQITDPQRVWDELLEPRMDGIVASIVNNKNLMSSLIGQMEKEDMSPEDYITNRIYPVIESMVYSEWYKTGVSREMPTNFAEYLQKRLKDSLVGMLIDTMVNSKTRRAMAQEAMAQTEEGEGSYTPSTVTKITGEAASIMADAPLFGVAGKMTAPIARATVNGLMGNYMERLIGRVAGASISSGYTIGGAEFIKGSLRGGIESDSDNIFGVVSDALGSGVESGIGGFKTGLAFFGRPIAQSIVNGTGAVRTALGLLSATVVNSIAATAAEAGEEYVTNGKVDVDKLPTSFAHNVMLFGVLEGRSLAKEVYHTAKGERYINNVRFSQDEVAQLESIEGVKNLRDLSQKIEKERREGNVETYAETAQSQRRRTRRQRDLTEEERKALNDAGAQFYEAVMSDKETPLETKVKVAQALQLPLTMEATAPEERFDDIEERDGKFVLTSRNMFGYKMAEQTFATREEAEQKRDEVEKQWMDEAKDGSSRMENIIAASNVYQNLADRMNEELNSGIVERAQRRKQLEAKANRAKKNKGIGMTRAERRELESLKPTNHERELLWIYDHNTAYEEIAKKMQRGEELTDDERMLALEMRSHVEKVASDYVNKEIKRMRDEFGVDDNDVDSLRDYIDWGAEEIERRAKEERAKNPEPREEVRVEEPVEEEEAKTPEEPVAEEEEEAKPEEEATKEETAKDDTTPDYSKVTSDDGVIREVTLKDGRKGYFVIRKGERIGDKYKIVDLDGNEMGEYDTSDIADFRETSAENVEETKPVENPVEEIKQDTYEDLINNWRDEQESVNTEGGLIRDEVSERALPTSWAGALHRVGRDIGKRFVVLSKEDVEAKYGKGVDGYTIGNTIYLNEDFVRRGDSFRSLITGHELTHILKKASPELWDAYVKSVKDAMGDEYEKVFADKRQKYDEKYDELGLERLTDADIDEEIACDYAGKNILTDADEARRIVESAESVGADPVKVVKQVLDWLKNTVDMLRQALSNGEDVNEQLAAYEQAQKLWQGMYQTAVAKRNAEKRQAETATTGEIEGGGKPRMSISSIFEGAGFVAGEMDDDGNLTPRTDKEGNVVITLDGREYSAKNPVTVKDLDTPNSPLSVITNYALEYGTADKKKVERIKQTYADIINMFLQAGSAEFGGTEGLQEQWLWLGESVFRTIATNGDKQYSYSADITRVCKKNEAVIRAISALQKEQGYGATPAQIMDIYERTHDFGYQVPCPVCYVFSRYLRNGKYASAAINGMRRYGKHLPNGSEPWTVEQWEDELHKLENLKKNKRIDNALKKANKDVTEILDAIDKRGKKLLNPSTSEEEKKKMKEEIVALDAQYRAAVDVINQQSLTNWIKTFAIQSIDGKTSIRPDAKLPENMQEFEENALDIRKVAETMRLYPAIQRLRKSGGAAAGKEITFASNNEFGEVISGVGTSNPAESINWFREIANAETEQERQQAEAKARKRFGDAVLYAARQSLRGGQRMWSWSDNIENLSPDVVINLMQMELLGGALQSYSKQLEGVALVATLDGYVNGSLMAKDNGWREVTDDMIENAKGMMRLKEPIWETIEEPVKDKGNVSRKRILAEAGSPIYEHNGKKYVLIFDDVIGIDPHGREEDGKHKKGLFELNKELSRAGNILVGMNDLHVRAALADDRIYFIIPWHASGQSIHILKAMLDVLGTDLRGFKPIDYTNMQEEKDLGKPNDKKEMPKVPRRVVEIWESHKNEKDFKSGIGEIPSGDGKGGLSEQQRRYRELRKKIFDGSIESDPEAKEQVERDTFLSQVYRKVKERAGTMTSTDNEFIYPYEYWDETSTYDTADVNGQRYLEYCRRLGVRPKFCGKWSPKGGWSNEGNFIDDKGFWKLLIDRRMYDVDKKFQDLTPVNTERFTPDLVDPSKTKEKYVSTEVADEEGTKKIVDAVIKQETDRANLAGRELHQANYDMNLEEAVDAYTKTKSGIRFRVGEITDDFTAEEAEGAKFRIVDDPEEIERLEKGEKETGYRNVVLNDDGSFGSPMANTLGSAGKKAEKTNTFMENKWEVADERPWLADENGKINLGKPDGLGSVQKVDYNPYVHIRPNKVNTQFKNAWERRNLVYIEVKYPASELTSGYHAEKAKLSVGKHPWNGGELILSRYNKPVGVCSWEEVADDWEKEFKGKGAHFDIVPPMLLPILKERGIKILPPHKNMSKECNDAYEAWESGDMEGYEAAIRASERKRGIKSEDNTRFRVSPEEDAEYMGAVEKGDMDKAQQMVLEAAKRAMPDTKVVDENGEPLVVYHGTRANDKFYEFKRNIVKSVNQFANVGFWFGESIDFAKDFVVNSVKNRLKYGKRDINSVDVRSIGAYISMRNPLVFETPKNNKPDELFSTPTDDAYDQFKEHATMFTARKFNKVFDDASAEEVKEYIEYLKEQGYDGIIIRNTYYDKGHNNGEPNTQYCVFDSNQIKSADPVTYDDNGKPIPLSERFNEGNDDIRFRVSDERRRREYAERQWKRAHNKAANTIKSLGISDNVTVVDTPEELAGYDSMTEQQKASKGWYDDNTGNIVVVVGNHTSPEDVQRTILREGVARYGLRQMFGQNYNNFLDNVLTNAETDIRREIVNIATRNGYDFRKATEEYLARLANDTDFERAMNQGWWSQIKSYFLDMLHSIGLADWIEDDLSDNELRYMLWRSYMNLTEPDRYRNPFNVAREISMRNTLNIEDYIPEGELSFEEEKRLRERVSEMSLDEARAAYERINNKMLDDESLDIDEHTEKVRLGWLNEHGLEGLGKAMADDFNSLVDKYGMGMLALRWDLQNHIEKIENEGEVRFSIRGEKGAANDVKAMANLDVAKEMEKAGEDTKKIWLATGWEKGKDGKWRNEIPDAKAKAVDPKKAKSIEDLVDAPELFEAYPELKEYKVKMKNMSMAGSVNHDEKMISLDTLYNTEVDMPEDASAEIERQTLDYIKNGRWRTAADVVRYKEKLKAQQGGKRRLNEEGLRTIIHEMQHAVQRIEGFAKGGNVSLMEADIMQEEQRQNPLLATFAHDIAGFNSAQKLISYGKQNMVNLLRRGLNNEGMTDEHKQRVEQLIAYLEGITEAQYKGFVKNAKSLWTKVSKQAKVRYNNLAGEVEARNTEKRSGMTDEERRETPLSATEDVKRDEQLIRFRLDEDAEDTEESSEGSENGEGSNEPLDENYDAGRKSLADSTLDALATLVEKNKQNVQLRKDALHHVGTMLMDLCKEMQERPYDNWDDSRKVSMGVRQAASKQRKFDKETVDGIVRLARTLIKSGLFKGFSPYEVNRLMSLVKNAAGRKDITKQAEKVVDILLNRQIKEMQSLLEKQMKVKGSKLNQRGVEVQGALDIHGQRVLDALKKGISRTEEELDNRINEVTERMNDENESIAKNAKAEWEGLMMAKAYQDGITKSKAEEVGLRQELKDAEEEMKAGRMSREAYNEFVKTTNDALRENKLERIRAYEDVIDNLTGGLRESVARAKEWKEQEQQRVQEIHHNANSDLEGIEPLEHKNIKIGWFEDAVKNNPVSRILFAPAATFDTMLRYFGGKHVDGKGYLWKRFMPQFVKASDSEWRNKYAAHKTLDEKVSEVFGKKMRWSDLFSIVRKMPTVKVSFWDAGEMQEHDLTQGNLLYIYAVNKMSDGKMKLRKMGITEEDVAAIEAQLDPRLKELIDWAQNDFLVKKREDYNKVHERMFGAPMAAIENYFPLKIVGRALDKTVDIGETHGETDKPSTIVGSVIKRVRNSKPLDVLNTDAFDTVLEHIDEMEHWASFAEFCRDLNTLLSYKNFRNKVENMKSLRFGTGKDMLNNFTDTAAIAAGAYSPKRGKIDKLTLNIAKGVTASKISLRIYTAFKQLTSYPAYFSEASVAELAKSSNPYGMYKSWKWAMENLPLFSKRWQSRQAGDQRLKETDIDWKIWKTKLVETVGRVGMSTNALVDAVTVAMGAKAIYETKKKRYLKDGYDEEKAEEMALTDATIAYNETQQSSEDAFLSAVQLDRSWSSVALTVFRNASMGYQRRYLQALSNMKRRTKKGYKEESIEFMKKQAMRDGLSEEQAERVAQRTYNRGLYKDLANVAIFGYVLQLTWNLAPYAPYLVLGDDDNEKKAMWEDAMRHALFGGIEGLAGGNIYSDIGNMMLEQKDEFAAYAQDPSWGALKDLFKDVSNHNFTLMPLSSDLQGVIKHMGTDPVTAVDDVVSLLIQSSIGTNPKTLTDAVVAIVDCCNGDLGMCREAALVIMRILQVPQPTIDKIYIDELGMSGKEARQLSVEELAKRYAYYKMHKNAPVMRLFTSKEDDSKTEDKYVKLFSEKVAERIERMSDEELMENFNSTQPKDISGRKIMSKEIAKRMDGKDSYGTSKTDYGKVYLEHRDYTDIAEDVLLQNALKEAKQDGYEERAKDIEDVRREITKLKKELTDVPFTLPDGTRVTADDIMNEIRQVRKDALKEFKITKSNK